MGAITSASGSGETVREDYSEAGNAWDYFSHDQARSRAPTAGARTAWPASPTTSSASVSPSRSGTGVDPILKERLFGLTNSESNHGEDVKEYYFYLDSTPTHSYMKYLYKYPQKGLSLRRNLVNTSRGRKPK